MEIKHIKWEEALPIRHQVLWPEKELDFCKVIGDEEAQHFGAFIDNKLTCVASIYIQTNSARLRKFATLEQFQDKGIGSKMLTHIIAELQAQNISYFWCDARKDAVGFYKRFGLQIEGGEFFKSGLPYFKMGTLLK